MFMTDCVTLLMKSRYSFCAGAASFLGFISLTVLLRTVLQLFPFYRNDI